MCVSLDLAIVLVPFVGQNSLDITLAQTRSLLKATRIGSMRGLSTDRTSAPLI